MNRDEIFNMPAGREMDRLIAEKVMGLSVYDGERKIVRYEGFHGQHKRTYTIPEIYVRVSGVANYSCDSYSTDIKYAWKVVEKVGSIDELHDVDIRTSIRGWYCIVFNSFDSFEANAETAPLAICRAALLAMVTA